jgi:hypothetical protein
VHLIPGRVKSKRLLPDPPVKRNREILDENKHARAPASPAAHVTVSGRAICMGSPSSQRSPACVRDHGKLSCPRATAVRV